MEVIKPIPVPQAGLTVWNGHAYTVPIDTSVVIRSPCLLATPCAPDVIAVNSESHRYAGAQSSANHATTLISALTDHGSTRVALSITLRLKAKGDGHQGQDAQKATGVYQCHHFFSLGEFFFRQALLNKNTAGMGARRYLYLPLGSESAFVCP